MQVSQFLNNKHSAESIVTDRLVIDGHNTEDKTIVLQILAVVGHIQAKCRVEEECVRTPSS